MYNVGLFPMQGVPPHRGHLYEIIQASTQCEKLYVVISHNEHINDELCKKSGIKPISLKQKARWLSIELEEFEHIKVLMVDETDIPVSPFGWEEWSKIIEKTVPEKFDVVFGGDEEYNEGYTKYFEGVTYVQFDVTKSPYPFRSTEIRKNIYKYWDYILGAARPFFAKRVLIVGTESCGKTTLTKMLAKIFYTSWAREEGRYYPVKYMGTNEDVYEMEDFYNICWEQRQIEDHALQTANKIVFFDTDAVVTQYYCRLYMGGEYEPIETLIDADRYDIVIMLTPDVKWVADGFRLNGDDNKRWELHKMLKQMYIDRGFEDKIIEIGGNYQERLQKAIDIAKSLIKED